MIYQQLMLTHQLLVKKELVLALMESGDLVNISHSRAELP